MSMSEAKLLKDWLDRFVKSGGTVLSDISSKREVFDIVNLWNGAFANCRDRGNRHFAKSSSVYLLSAHRGLRIPAHDAQGFTFALKHQPAADWNPDVSGLPGEFVLFDAGLKWSISVTHEETEVLCLLGSDNDVRRYVDGGG
jgi:hypothetical protein